MQVTIHMHELVFQSLARKITHCGNISSYGLEFRMCSDQVVKAL